MASTDLSAYYPYTTAALGKGVVTPGPTNTLNSGGYTDFGPDIMHLTPYIIPSGGHIVGVQSACMSVKAVKMGLYYNTSDSVMYPSALIADFGVNVAGTRPLVTNLVLPYGGLYWLAQILPSLTTTVYMIRGDPGGAEGAAYTLGIKSDFSTAYIGYSVPRTYAQGFPPGFPAGATRSQRTPITYIEFGA